MIRALLRVFVLCVVSWTTSAVAAEPVTAILLVARGGLPDPNFRDSIVLVMNHLGPAPGGVIINRPTRIPVAHLFPELERLARLGDKVYFGGPVDLQTLSFLVRSDKPLERATKVLDGIYVSTSRELLRELLGRDKPMEGVRIFIGYAGWAPGQLENEIARGDWILERAEAARIFDAKPEHPWPGRQPPARAGVVRAPSSDLALRTPAHAGAACPDGVDALSGNLRGFRTPLRGERAPFVLPLFDRTPGRCIGDVPTSIEPARQQP